MIDICVNNDNNAYILMADASGFLVQKKDIFSADPNPSNQDFVIPSKEIGILYSEKFTSVKDISISLAGDKIIVMLSSKSYGPLILDYSLEKKIWEILYKP